MSDDLIVIDGSAEEDPDYDAQIEAALEKALEIHGTIINDLQFAINVAMQYRRQYDMLGAPDPQKDNLDYLIRKYDMAREEYDAMVASSKLLTEGRAKELNERND